MNVEVKPGRLKESRPWELALRFGFGGLCTVIAGLIAKKFGPVAGGLFLAFPAIFPSGASLIESHEQQRKQRVGKHGQRLGRRLASVDAAGAAMGCIGLAVFAAVVWRELPGRSATGVIALATAAWVVVSAGVWYGLRRWPAIRTFRRRSWSLRRV